jgi:hypothetical protein
VNDLVTRANFPKHYYQQQFVPEAIGPNHILVFCCPFVAQVKKWKENAILSSMLQTFWLSYSKTVKKLLS